MKIVNRGKDHFIKLLQQEREEFAEQRKHSVEKPMTFNRRIGQLETRLEIEPPTQGFDVIRDENRFGDTPASRTG